MPLSLYQLSQLKALSPLTPSQILSGEISGIFCCDLLSHALSRLPAGYAWITVLPHPNTLAIAVQNGCPCLIFPDSIQPSSQVVQLAEVHGLSLWSSSLPSFETGQLLAALLDT